MVKKEDLRRIGMFRNMPDELLDIVSQEAQLNIYGAQTRLFSMGENIDTFYMIVMGQVALEIPLSEDVDVILDYLQAGRSFGSSALIQGACASYSAVCQEPCEVITVHGSRLLQLFETNKKLAYYIMTGVAGQYKRTMEERAQMIIRTLEDHPDLKEGIHDIEDLTPAF